MPRDVWRAALPRGLLIGARVWSPTGAAGAAPSTVPFDDGHPSVFKDLASPLLDAEAGRQATGLAREAIEHWLTERERLVVHEAIAEYARAEAGSAADLDDVLERAASDEVERATRSKRSRRR